MTAATIVTHAARSSGTTDDHLLSAALSRRGIEVRFAVWDDRAVDWSATPITIVRSTWDYHLKCFEWFAWLEHAAGQTWLVNPKSVLRWSSEKGYLLDLESRGVAILPTVLLEESNDLLAACQQRGWNDVVVKPAIGASSYLTRRFNGVGGLDEASDHARQLLQHGRVLVQRYEATVEHERERSLVIMDGAFSHAFTKPPFLAGVGNDDGLERHAASAAEIDFALRALAEVDGDPRYARVDMLPCEDGLRVMEVELVEPQLALHLSPPAADRLVSAILEPSH